MPKHDENSPARRKYGFDEQCLQKAIEEVTRQTNPLSLNKAAKKYGISAGTLHNKINRKHTGKVGRPTVLSVYEENIFLNHIITVSEWGFPFVQMDLRFLCKSYLDKIGRNVQIFKNNLPSKDWVKSFLDRNTAISQRLAQNIKRARAKVTVNEVEEYFRHLKETLSNADGTPVAAANVINYDETNLNDDPGRIKCIFRRGVKYPERILDSSKSSTSVMFSGCADGTLLPPYVVYKAVGSLQEPWILGAPKGTRFHMSKSGWFDSGIFADWFERTLVPHVQNYLKGKVVVIGDNLSSHFSEKVLTLAGENNIDFVCLLPNSTHLLQPLDVAFYAPLKRQWRMVLSRWKLKSKKKSATVSKSDFPSLLKELMEGIVESGPRNLRAGFAACGIHPFNPHAVLKRLPDRTTNSENLTTEVVSSSVLEMLKDMRSGNGEPAVKRRKKINVSPGMSITLEDWQVAQSVSTSKQSEKNSLPESLSPSDESNSEPEVDMTNNEIEIDCGSFYVVKLPTEQGTHRFYMGKAEESGRENEPAMIRFMRRSRKSRNNKFVWPIVVDRSLVKLEQILRKVENVTLERRGSAILIPKSIAGMYNFE